MTRYMKLSWERRRRDVKRAREKKRERQKKGGWRKLGLGLMKSSCRDYVWQYEMNACQLNHQAEGSGKSIYLHMDRFDIFQCMSLWVLHVCGKVNRVYVSWSDVCVYGQGFYFGQAPVNDIKSVGVTAAKTEKREGTVYKARESSWLSGLESYRWHWIKEGWEKEKGWKKESWL